ncbi:SpaH/EbpB family LPXTG-anchored major pilin [Corynebacterium marquesiae]|uniref:SpaH/EbpB family LPXTG-anchored major pilin n=1 Tax=Corynebacterium TaxID=1716 RepID=UPI001EF69C79|nr:MULTISPECIES: SpaH/EbpB family LPXTG-anchored major pilin [Corynebacterium]MCG7446582.1 SpaH/EbpB family LPXTG-anchored major pilin [Corynebacterium sp. ACRPO]MDK7048121.1 SpaH/EbpB family LPXTG-anchored major pilin [Corynebacterium sp. UMB0012]MDK8455316.1 SpaH/EbpB family LPXTG-anchored major pilin [Corynebacterium marquesiae]MDK8725411.1 SpaH/EbpB family LPXTG-anchored major pilin [Corynebacterium marquesiae]MDK8770753.1 SpaH/EbpB family LPXTG-anchored major pilin [Corynebacterium marque
MKKNTLTIRSVTFAAVAGLSLGIAAPGAIAGAQESTVNQTAGDSPLVNKDARGALTIHKFGNPINEGTPSGTLEDAKDVERNGGKALEGVGFTVYKINKTADGATDIDVTTNKGLVAASKLKAADFSQGAQLKGGLPAGVLTEVASGTTGPNGTWEVSKNLELGAYLVVETTPKEGYDPAVPFIAFVPMTADNGGDNQGTSWNYDVHAFPKNYKDEEPTKTVKDKDQNAGDENLVYTVTGTARQLKPNTERTQFQITDQIDPKLEITDVTVKVAGQEIQPTQDVDGKFYEGNNVDVSLNEETAKSLKAGDKVEVIITTTLKPEFKNATDIAPNKALVFQNNPDGSESQTPKETPEVKTYWGGLQFKKVDGDRNGLEGAEFQIARQAAGQQCSDIDTTKKDSWAPVNGEQDGQVKTTFVSGQDGTVKITGLHVNDFEDNAEVAAGEQSHYCLIEVKAPKGKELLPEALEFKLVASETTPERVYELASVQVGANEGEVVNSDDTTPNLPMTGGMGVGILAAIGAAIVAAGAWFARRGAKN